MTRKRTLRPTAQIVRGLDDIYSFMGAEWEAQQASMMECQCPACQINDRNCHCFDKPYAKRCDQCRCHEDIGAALGYIGSIIDRHRANR
jgi:hypothetical protein